MAQVATAQLQGQHPQQQSPSSNGGQQHQQQQQPADSKLGEQLLVCFQAWIRLGSLHEISAADSQSLVSFALRHLEDPRSPAFPVSGEVLAELMDHCPQEWLPALHDPIMRAAQLARQAADAGATAAVETLCKVVSAYAALCINIFEPSSSPESSATKDVLMGLALLPHVADQGAGVDGAGEGDPVCAAALATWTLLAEYLLDTRVGGYDVFDEEDFFHDSHADGHATNSSARRPAARVSSDNGHHGMDEGAYEGEDAGGQHWQDQQHGGGGGHGGFTTASGLMQSQEEAAQHVSAESKALYEHLLCGLLNNLVVWQQPPQQQKQQQHAQAAPIEHFTPTFTSTLNDCLASCCSVVGPRRFTSLLWMLMDRPATDPLNPLAAAAVLYAVSAAGSLQLVSHPESLQTLAGIMSKAASQQPPAASPATFLVQFCCAAAACCRPCLKALAEGRQDTSSFMTATVHKALQALNLPAEDSLDVRTPAAITLKQLMQGARDAGLAVPTQLVQSLAGVLQQGVGHRDMAAEQALVLATTTCCACLPGGAQAQQQALCGVYESMAGQLRASVQHVAQQLSSGARSWAALCNEGVDGLLAGHLRRYSLLLQHELQASGANGAEGAPEQGAPGAAAAAAPPAASEGLRVLCAAFLDHVWPQLSVLVNGQQQQQQQGGLDGEFLSPTCRCLALIIRSQLPAVHAQLQGVLEALAGAMFRPHGRPAAEPFCAALMVYGAHEQVSRLAHHAVSAVLGTARSAVCRELRGADKDPELAEALLKVAGAYMRRTFGVLVQHDPQQARSALEGVCMLVAACCCANHRAVGHAALAALSGVLDAAQAAPNPEVAATVQALLCAQGGVLTTGLLGTLLTLSPLPRVPKVQSLLIQLYTQLLSGKPSGNSNSCGGTKAGAANGHAAGNPTAGSQQFAAWLNEAAQQFQLATEEREAMLRTWPAAVADAAAAAAAAAQQQQQGVAAAGQQPPAPAAAAVGAAREQQAAAKRLKKLLRDFAELHSRTQ